MLIDPASTARSVTFSACQPGGHPAGFCEGCDVLRRSELIETENHLIVELPISRRPEQAFWSCLNFEHPVFLDSSMVDGRLGRHSVIGFDPFAVLRSRGGITEVKEGTRRRVFWGDPFAIMSDMLGRYKTERASLESAPAFLGGAVGYISYDAGRWLERLPVIAADDRGLPDIHLGFYDALAVFDLVVGASYAVAFKKPGESREDCFGRLKRLVEVLSGRVRRPLAGWSAEKARMRSSFTERDYMRAVERAKSHIEVGDIFQVNLSHRFTLPMDGEPYSLYFKLRETNPAPFSAFLGFGNVAVASSSPERFIKAECGLVETRPIKGTRPRSDSEDVDERLARELLASEKDSAEHVMIVDVERNDFGRVCVPGSVRVPELMRLESYATVHHLVSTIVGRLSPDKGQVDVLRASFPGGSITGAPKIRAMEIIEEIEPVRRGIYTGSVVYCGFDGYMDSSIVIRTFVASRSSSAYRWRLDFHVGGGIVADSDPKDEYQETLDKAQGLIAALEG